MRAGCSSAALLMIAKEWGKERDQFRKEPRQKHASSETKRGPFLLLSALLVDMVVDSWIACYHCSLAGT